MVIGAGIDNSRTCFSLEVFVNFGDFPLVIRLSDVLFLILTFEEMKELACTRRCTEVIAGVGDGGGDGD